MTIKQLILTIFVVAAAPAEPPISPGKWEVTNQLHETSIGGRRQSFSGATARPAAVCLQLAEASKGPGLAFSDPELCTVSRSTMERGHYEYDLQCKATESGDNIVTKVAGSFTATDYTGEEISIQKRGSSRIEMRSKITARRVGDC
jgi:hypothetical protein